LDKCTTATVAAVSNPSPLDYSGRLKMQEWKKQEQVAGVENAGVENAIRSKLQGRKMREWK